MLYVFHVDGGQMTTYDMNLTLQSVATLKSAIERKTKIPASSVVLLVSGGEVLQSDHMVSSYSAGTDTNPIYMFSKPSVNQSHLSTVCSGLSPVVEVSTGEFRSDMHSVSELRSAVERCCSMPPTWNTVISCATLAQEFMDFSHEVSRSCDQLVHDQHLQHQGWAAVVANLEDIFSEFCERSRNFKESFKKHRLKKEEYRQQLNALNEVLESLDRIPILPALQLNAVAHRFSAFDVYEDTDFEGQCYKTSQPLDSSSENRGQDFGVEALRSSEEDVFGNKESISSKDVPCQSTEAEPPMEESDEGVTFRAHAYEEKEKPTLLNWILAQGNKASLQDIVDYCDKGLELIETEPLKEREAELCSMLEYANLHGLKQIKGIEDRLYRLDQLLSDVKKRERAQHDQAASLTQYRDRMHSSCDPSVLPTLVQSHFCQLEKLFIGHEYLIDIKRRIAKSKDELSHILKARLEAVLMIENSMSVQDAHAMLNFQCLNRLARYFDIVAQLHRAPAVFVRAVGEVARRRTFSHAHLTWATDIANKLLKIHDEEVLRRQQFNAVFEGHFLRSLFPGMSELPPPFATQAPPVFDARLPKLSDEDIKHITETFPDLVKDVPSHDMDNIVKFFQQRLIISQELDKSEHEDEGDLKDAESETGTGDFERLSGQISHRQKVDISTICVPETFAVSTVTEDNMDSHRIQLENLQTFLNKLFILCRANILFIKEELCKLRQDIDEQKKLINFKYIEILEEWQRSNEENAIKFREQTQRLTVDHELELSDMKGTLNSKDETIEALKKVTEDLQREHEKEKQRLEMEHQNTRDLLDKTREDVEAMEAKFQEAEMQKQKIIKELQEKMHQEYKAEIESLRSRFRLVAVTNMDRSPSESSLERIERTDVIEISSHNAIVMQTKENAEVEKEEAVRAAIERCEAEWSRKFSEEMGSLKSKYETDKQGSINEVTRRLLSEKDRQLELLRDREQALSRECVKFRETIQQLTDPDTDDAHDLLKCQIATLENEKTLLQQQVAELKIELEKKSEQTQKQREDGDDRTSPKREESSKRMSRSRSHTPLGLAAGTLSLATCLPGHTVLVLWDPAHQNYTVLQEAAIMFFVNSDCLPALGLSLQVKNESERRLYAVGVVEGKDYCYAKKSGNRYHMPNGSRFYRVQLRAARALPPAVCCLADHRHKQDISRSVDTSQSTSSVTEDGSRASQTTEVATATLINLESPVSGASTTSAGDAPIPHTAPVLPADDQLDSIEASDHWQPVSQNASNLIMSDMECSVGQLAQNSQGVGDSAEPLEVTVSALDVSSRASLPPELAEEAAP